MVVNIAASRRPESCVPLLLVLPGSLVLLAQLPQWWKWDWGTVSTLPLIPLPLWFTIHPSSDV